eukprot:TRINITY_DN26334_c0_g1_i1.p1 TRINITY_DN26334_c0_g1~~TRINITY_DN26334_c0_g1_i1.p1  ORF type:complete len:123 (+),score=15.07 TRINITY_DN26334_c0_g1_i1:41-370(+)
MTDEYLNLKKKDPFADEFEGNGKDSNYVHIRIQQRNARKSITTVQGLPEDLDLKKIVKYFRKEFSCNGTIVDSELGKVIQLQGDHRQNIQMFLVREEICEKESIKIHGF